MSSLSSCFVVVAAPSGSHWKKWLVRSRLEQNRSPIRGDSDQRKVKSTVRNEASSEMQTGVLWRREPIWKGRKKPAKASTLSRKEVSSNDSRLGSPAFYCIRFSLVSSLEGKTFLSSSHIHRVVFLPKSFFCVARGVQTLKVSRDRKCCPEFWVQLSVQSNSHLLTSLGCVHPLLEGITVSGSREHWQRRRTHHVRSHFFIRTRGSFCVLWVSLPFPYILEEGHSTSGQQLSLPPAFCLDDLHLWAALGVVRVSLLFSQERLDMPKHQSK